MKKKLVSFSIPKKKKFQSFSSIKKNLLNLGYVNQCKKTYSTSDDTPRKLTHKVLVYNT